MRYSRHGYTLPEILCVIVVLGVSAGFFSSGFAWFRHAGQPVVLAALATMGMIVAFWIAFAGCLWAIAGAIKLIFFRRTPWRVVFHGVVTWLSIACSILSLIAVMVMAVWNLANLIL